MQVSTPTCPHRCCTETGLTAAPPAPAAGELSNMLKSFYSESRRIGNAKLRALLAEAAAALLAKGGDPTSLAALCVSPWLPRILCICNMSAIGG